MCNSARAPEQYSGGGDLFPPVLDAPLKLAYERYAMHPQICDGEADRDIGDQSRYCSVHNQRLFPCNKRMGQRSPSKRQPISRLDDGGGKVPVGIVVTKLPRERPILIHRYLAAFASFNSPSISVGDINRSSRRR